MPNNDFLQEMGKKLTRLRNQTGLTQKDFAVKINLTREAYAQYETGRRCPDFETLKAIATFHGISTDYLLEHSITPRDHSLEKAILGSSYLDDGTPISEDDKRKLLESMPFIQKIVKSIIT